MNIKILFMKTFINRGKGFRSFPAIILFSFLITLSGVRLSAQQPTMTSVTSNSNKKWVLVIHGGAGSANKDKANDERDKVAWLKIKEALNAGATILRNNGTSLDAVEKVIKMLEDSPLFNAGKGSVFTAEGKNEMDASIMDGKTMKAGAVAGVTTIKNPISAARAVMEKSNHVMLADGGAEIFAKQQGLEIVDPSYFYTKERWDQLQKAKQQEKQMHKDTVTHHGTVGAVALDMNGNLAAATSTGGMTNKMKGRIGDSPIIGAGTYANNNTCAVSCTGHGEFFIRNVVAYDISAQMEYRGTTLDEAATHEVMEKLKGQGAEGGLIAVDKDGNISMPFNTQAMLRGYITSEGAEYIRLFK
jgi:beta-aspartyl-peptidase (threonine type)